MHIEWVLAPRQTTYRACFEFLGFLRDIPTPLIKALRMESELTMWSCYELKENLY